MLEEHLEWLLTDVIPGFQRSNQAPGHKARSIRMAEQQVDNIRWRLETGNDAPICGWKKSYRSHPADCAYCKTGKIQTGFALRKPGKPDQQVSEVAPTIEPTEN